MNESCVTRASVTSRLFLLVAPWSSHSSARCCQTSLSLVVGWMLRKVCSVILLVIPGPPLEGLQVRHKRFHHCTAATAAAASTCLS